jgi:hypothetical protein
MRDHLDSQIRELTCKLVHLAPEAPPFPEVSMATLTPEKQTSSPRPPRRPSAAWAAAAAFVVVLLIGIPLLFLRGDTEPVAPATTVTTIPDTTVTTVPVAVTSFDVTLYYLADYVEASNTPGPHLLAQGMSLSVGSAGESGLGDAFLPAFDALLAGPQLDDPDAAGVSTAIPGETVLRDARLDPASGANTVVLDFNRAFESGGGTFSMGARLAQVVYTATQFEGIDAVVFLLEGEPVTVFSSEGIVLDGPQTRADYTDILPLILVDSPAEGATVTSPFDVTGIANTFEANVQYELLIDGIAVWSGFTTAGCGSGCWGDYTFGAFYDIAEPQTGTLVVFDTSAEDGARQTIVRRSLTLTPGEPFDEGDAPDDLYLGAGIAFSSGTGYFPGMVVTDSPLPVEGGTLAAAGVTVNGAAVGLSEFGGFSASVDLVPGENTIPIVTRLGEQMVQDDIVVTYVPGGETNFAFLTQVGTSELTADYAQWLTGDEANQAAFDDGFISSIEEGVPNDYYIRNTNDALRDLPVASDVVVMLISPVDVAPIAVDIDEWVALFKPDGTPWDYEAGDEPPTWDEPYFGYYGASSSWTPYWLTLDAEGAVIQIVQQYLP